MSHQYKFILQTLMVPELPEECPLHQTSSPDHPQNLQQTGGGGTALLSKFVLFLVILKPNVSLRTALC